jgi:uncharacterized protein (DUF1501 family)
MKTIRRILPFFLLILVACAGAAARQNVLLPAMDSNWQQLRPGIERELAAAPNPAGTTAVAAANDAFKAANPAALMTVDWQLLDSIAEADVVRQLADGKLGPIGADSRRKLIAEFAEARGIYARTRTP